MVFQLPKKGPGWSYVITSDFVKGEAPITVKSMKGEAKSQRQASPKGGTKRESA